VRHAPEKRTNFVRLAYLLRRQAENTLAQRKKNSAEADQVIDQQVSRHVDSGDAYLARWRYRRDFDLLLIRETEGTGTGQGELEKAAQDVREAIKRQPQSVDVLLAAADLERLRGRAAAEDPGLTPAQRMEGLRKHRQVAFTHLKRGLSLVAKKKGATEKDSKF